MLFLYNITLHISYFFVKLIALFNKKLNLFVSGRKESFSKLAAITSDDKVVWIHAASLGEFEQGRPIIEYLKTNYPNHKIVVTFFSPSGYEIRKNYNLADVVCYLPFDTKANMRKFVKQLHPDVAIIIKYEFWINLLNELHKNNVKTILVSGIFRENQMFFKAYGGFMRKSLNAFDHFFVQNEISKQLLNSINFKNVTISGDTRFDRVSQILNQDNSLDFIEEFKDQKYTIVAGSTWKEDEELLVNYINSSEGEKFIIAPHNIHQKNIEELKNSITQKVVLFSEKEGKILSDYQVFIIDTIGILTKIYSYADIAYVGGGLLTGLHNILEPATFGVPIVFGGNKYQKFQEAIDLIELGGSELIYNQSDFSNILNYSKMNSIFLSTKGEINKKYVAKRIGATEIISKYLLTQIQK